MNQAINQNNSRGVIVKQGGKSLTIFSKNSDITTIIHEKAHEYEDVLTKDEIRILEQWSGFKFGTTEFSEAFAKGAEKVIYDGSFGNKEVDNIFKKLAKWFKEVISNAIAYFSDLNEMNQDVLDIYAHMLIYQSEDIGGQSTFEGFEHAKVSENESEETFTVSEVYRDWETDRKSVV